MASKKFQDKIIKCLELTRKTGVRDYFKEYNISIFQVKMILQQANYPQDLLEYLDNYCVDLASFAVYRHLLGTTESAVTLSSCYKIFIGDYDNDPIGKGTITDVSWN